MPSPRKSLKVVSANRCAGCNRTCATLYCDGCAPSSRSDIDTRHLNSFFGGRSGGKNWSSKPSQNIYSASTASNQQYHGSLKNED